MADQKESTEQTVADAIRSRSHFAHISTTQKGLPTRLAKKSELEKLTAAGRQPFSDCGECVCVADQKEST